MGQGKSLWYTHRLMHRKRVTCELHDSYFRLMMIKHDIPKIEWAIEWPLNYYIIRSRQEVKSWRKDELETRCGRESHTRPKGPSGPPVVSDTRGQIHNYGFLEVNYQRKFLYKFGKKTMVISWLSWSFRASKAVSPPNIRSRTRMFLAFFL